MGKSFSSREVIKMLKSDGWYFIGCTGDHHFFKHPSKPGRVVVPHPTKDIKPKTLQSILKQAGLGKSTDGKGRQ